MQNDAGLTCCCLSVSDKSLHVVFPFSYQDNCLIGICLLEWIEKQI